MGRREHVVVLHEVARVLVRGAADADGHRGDERARVVEGLHRRHEALLRGVRLLAAEQVLLGHAAVLEHELRGLVRAEAHLVLDLADLEARACPSRRRRRGARRGRARGSTVAKIDRPRSRGAPFVMKHLRPFRTQCLPSFRQLVRMPATSLPAPGSVSAVGAPAELARVHVLEHAEEALLLLGRAGRAHRRAAEAGARQQSRSAASPHASSSAPMAAVRFVSEAFFVSRGLLRRPRRSR